MPMPWTYRHAHTEWRGFLDDIAEVLDTPSSNVAYTSAEGVLHAFRRRLTPNQAMIFADALPAMLRALFLQGYRCSQPENWADAPTYQAEASALRKDHNFAGEKALEAVSYALHRAMGPDALIRELERIGPEAHAFWHLTGYDEADLQFRFR